MHAQKLCKIFFQSLCLLHSYHIQARMRVALPLVTRHATTDTPISVCLSVAVADCLLCFLQLRSPFFNMAGEKHNLRNHTWSLFYLSCISI